MNLSAPTSFDQVSTSLQFLGEQMASKASEWLTDRALRELEASVPLWTKHFYPTQYHRPFSTYQLEFLNWIGAFERTTRRRPRVECEPRGVGKSSNLRAGIVYLMARKLKSYILYVSATRGQAKKHFNAIRKQLENESLLRHYPHLAPQKSVHRNAQTNWSADRLVTAAGQVVEFISILGNARGFNTEEGRRLDLIAVDDIDDQKDSVDTTEKKLDIIASNILGAGDEETDVIVAQNLIHRTSIVSRLRSNTAGILLDRHFVGPFPIAISYDYAEEAIEGDTTGAKRYVLTDFQPFDPTTSREYVEQLLNRLGYKGFERECQQNLDIIDDDKDFREFSERHHVITYSEFRRYWESQGVQVWSEERQRLFIPSQWNGGLGQDWGTTPDHPTAIFNLFRPNQHVPLNDCFFTFGEVVTPEYPRDVNRPATPVSPRRVAKLEKAHLAQWNVQPNQIVLRRMSHEASTALNSFAEDLEPELKIYYSKWKAARGSGVPQWQNVLEIDYSKTHPFRIYPDGHPQAGEHLIGRPKWFMVVPDEQGALRVVRETGHLFVSPAFDADGCARLRAEIPVYATANTGKSKIFDDAVDAGRGIMGEFVIRPQERTEQERFDQHLATNKPHLQPEVIAAEQDEDRKQQLIADQLWERKMIKQQDRRKGVEQSDLAQHLLDTDQTFDFSFLGE